MLRRIDTVVATGKHCDSTACQACTMRRLIDTACQSRYDDETGIAEIMRQRLRELVTGAGCIA